MNGRTFVDLAKQHPLTYFPTEHPAFPRGISFAQVCFAYGTFTVADNGDAEDYTDPDKAAEALEMEWNRALDSLDE